ncbi:MAG: hypothetical protein NTZ09_15775, partial [Candidatus Hydrogenedentes bacterium]|nr:hypothetical protein [Candidatus Hydrogenedentota bacterium]
ANLSFFRPLSALTHYADFRFFRSAWWLMHAHSLLWYGLLCAMVALLYRRMLPVPWVAGLAALLYAIDDAHGIPAGWLANRNALMTTLFGVLVLISHDAGRRGAMRSGVLLATLSLIIGLGCGEAMVSVGGYLLAYALFMDKGSFRNRLLSLVPYAAVVLVYLIFYRVQNYGTGGSGLYQDPFSHPGRFLSAILMHLPSLIHGQLGLVPANIYVLLPQSGQAIHSLVGIAAMAVFFILFWPLLKADARTRPLARFWAAGMVLSAFPVCATLPGERLLCFPGIGAMALVAMFIQKALAAWNNPQPSWRRRFNKAAVYFLIGAHLIIAPLAMPFSSISASVFGRAMELGISKLPANPDVAQKSLVILRAPLDVFVCSLYHIRFGTGQAVPRHTWALAVGTAAVKATRIDTHTIDVWQEGGFFAFPCGTTFRGPQDPFRVGDVLTTDGFTATVLHVTEDQRPQVIRFRFNVPLEDPSLLWYRIGPGDAVRIDPPLPGAQVYQAPADLFSLLMPQWKSRRDLPAQ